MRGGCTASRDARGFAQGGLDEQVLPGNTRFVKTAVSLPDDTFRRIDLAARRLGLSRSAFLARAAERWLEELDDDALTRAVNEALAGVDQEVEFVSAAAATLTVD